LAGRTPEDHRVPFRAICAGLSLVLVALAQPAARAADSFSSSGASGEDCHVACPELSPEQALQCARDRVLRYAEEPPPRSAACECQVICQALPADKPVLLKGGVSDSVVVEEGAGTGTQRSAGIYDGGTVPQHGSGGMFDTAVPPGGGLQGGTTGGVLQGGVSQGGGGGGGTVLQGGVSQGQQGAVGYPPPRTQSGDAPVPVFTGGRKIDNVYYTIRATGQPEQGEGWGDFTNPDRKYLAFYGQVVRRGAGFVFVITKLRRFDGTIEQTYIEVNVARTG
jgi:hypothetical protein